MKKLLSILLSLTLLGGSVVSAADATPTAGSFTIDFTVSELKLDVTAENAVKENFSLLDSTNGVMSLYVPKGQDADEGSVYFKIYGNRFTVLMASQPIENVKGYENIIAVDKEYKEVRWYVLDESGKIDNDKTVRVDLLKFNGKYADIDTITESYSPFGGGSSVGFDSLIVKEGALNKEVLVAVKKIGEKDGSSFEEGSLKTLADMIGYLSDKVTASDKDVLTIAYEQITKGELEETEQSMNQLKKYIECARIFVKNKSEAIDGDELDYFAGFNLSEDVYALLEVISDDGVKNIASNLKSSKSGSYSAFCDAVREQIIINSITNASGIDYSGVAERITKYASELGINLNGFDKLKTSARNEVVAKLIAANPSSVADINSVLKKAVSTTTTSGDSNKKGSGGGGGGGGGAVTTPTLVVDGNTKTDTDATTQMANYLVAPFTLSNKDTVIARIMELIKK